MLCWFLAISKMQCSFFLLKCTNFDVIMIIVATFEDASNQNVGSR